MFSSRCMTVKHRENCTRRSVIVGFHPEQRHNTYASEYWAIELISDPAGGSMCYRLQHRWELPGPRLPGSHHAVHARTFLLWCGVEHNHPCPPSAQDGTQHGGIQRWETLPGSFLICLWEGWLYVINRVSKVLQTTQYQYCVLCPAAIQALRSVLNSFSVVNRKNMFVYQERTTKSVFYLRLLLWIRLSLVESTPVH